MIPIIIVVFNRPEYTETCLDSLLTTKHGVDIVPIIVNNFSRKTTNNLLSSWIDKCKSCNINPILITLEKNLGFAGGVNAGLDYVLNENFKEVCILHNDTILSDNWLYEMNLVLNSDEDVAVVSPRTNYANEQAYCIKELREKFEIIKPPNKEPITKEEILNLIKKTYEDFGGINAFSHSLKETTPDSSHAIDIASFCALVKSSMFLKYGKFDATFWPRMYEDKFWFQPLQFDGYSCSIANRAFVHHFGNVTSDGPGFCFPDIAKINEQKFKAKVEELISQRGLR